MNWIESILMAASLCADCLAVSLCSGVTLRKMSFRSVSLVALSFAVIQTLLLFIGWESGNLLVGFVEKVSSVIAFLLLLYVGGGMLMEGIRNCQECRNLNGLKNIAIGGLATSLDALAVGGSMSMDHVAFPDFYPLMISVFIITALSVVLGICSGRLIGSRFGRWAEIIGGLVLIGIGAGILL